MRFRVLHLHPQSDDFPRQPFADWDGRERIMINVHAIYRGLMGRQHAGTLERLNLLRKTALLAKEWSAA